MIQENLFFESSSNESRLSGGKHIQLAKRGSPITARVGDVVQLRLGSGGLNNIGDVELGVVTEAYKGRDCVVRTSSGRTVQTSAATLTPISSGPGTTEGEMMDASVFTHFISVGIESASDGNSVTQFQGSHENYLKGGYLNSVVGIGEKVALSKLHVTLAVLNLSAESREELEDEEEKVAIAMESALRQLHDAVAGPSF